MATRPARIPESLPGRRLVLASWWGTGLFTVSAVLGVVAPDAFRVPSVVVALTLFAAGIVTFLWAFAISVERSRYELLSVGGIYFLAGGVAHPSARRHLLASVGVQVVVAFATAGARPFTVAAFGILVPMFGLGTAGVWTAKHGEFPERVPEPKRPSPGTTPERAGQERDSPDG